MLILIAYRNPNEDEMASTDKASFSTKNSAKGITTIISCMNIILWDKKLKKYAMFFLSELFLSIQSLNR